MIHRARRWIMRFDLSDEEWALLEPLLPKSRKSARVDDRKIVNAIFYVLRTGMPWRDLPTRYGPYTTAYNRFNRWSRRGIWKRVFDQLASKSRDSLYLIDSTVVKAHRAASGGKGEKNQAIGISRGGRTTKIHAIVDSKGRPLSFTVTGGQVHDSQVVEEILNTPRPPLAVTADKAYDSEKVRQQIRDEGALPVIPNRCTATKKAYCPKRFYRRRHKIENFFCRIKDWRRIATRYDKLARNFLAAATLVGVLYWIKL
ncbi:MAG TPA: IS5 family transposase [Chitinivibrionales bacterium]|nr:IS5 family transposase [Chitinivibrionales bacterium]